MRDWIDDFNRRQRAMAAESREVADQALGRLCDKITAPLQEWVDAEMASGTPPGAIIEALTNLYANQMASVMFCVPKKPEVEANVLREAARFIEKAVPHRIEILREAEKEYQRDGQPGPKPH